MDDRLEFSFAMQEKDYAHFLAMKDQWKAWKSGRRCLHPDERYLRQILASPELKKHLGQMCIRDSGTGLGALSGLLFLAFLVAAYRHVMRRKMAVSREERREESTAEIYYRCV